MLVVKRFLERFGTWIVLATGLLLTVTLLLSGSIARAWSGTPARAVFRSGSPWIS